MHKFALTRGLRIDNLSSRLPDKQKRKGYRFIAEILADVVPDRAEPGLGAALAPLRWCSPEALPKAGREIP